MSSKWVDLSHEFYEGMPYNKLLDPPKIDRVYTLDDHLFQLTRYTFFTHLSTHMDSPCHFIRGGKSIEEITPEESSGSAVVWSIPKPPFGEITVRDLENASPKVQTKEIVFLRTGWGAKFDLQEYHDHPYLTGESSQWLVDKGVKLVGVDFITVDLPPQKRQKGFDCPAHRTLLGNDVLILENVYLEEVIGKRLEVVCFPIKIRGSDGAPARVMAQVQK